MEAVFEAVAIAWTPPLSPLYQQVLQQAHEEARHYGASLVGTPHLFLALHTFAPDPLRQALHDCSALSPEAIGQTLRSVLEPPAPGRKAPTARTLPLHHVLREAQTLAQDIKADRTDVEHLWVALCKEERSLFTQVLTQYGVSRAQLLEAMRETMEQAC